MYANNPFGLAKKEEITADIQELAGKRRPYRRVYLLNGDPFCLSADKLIWIIDEIQRYIPTVETVTMYASIHNVAAKSDEELVQLKSGGVPSSIWGWKAASAKR